jgi:hypothetical protein
MNGILAVLCAIYLWDYQLRPGHVEGRPSFMLRRNVFGAVVKRMKTLESSTGRAAMLSR